LLRSPEAEPAGGDQSPIFNRPAGTLELLPGTAAMDLRI